jgi:hypothetical protein
MADLKAADEQHTAFVTAWLAEATADLTPAQVLDLAEEGLNRLWRRVNLSIGVLTLQAILDRAIFVSADLWPPIGRIRVDATGVHCRDLRQDATDEHAAAMIAGFQGLFVNLLTILSDLTADMLTEALYQTISPFTTTGPDPSRRPPGRFHA